MFMLLINILLFICNNRIRGRKKFSSKDDDKKWMGIFSLRSGWVFLISSYKDGTEIIQKFLLSR